MKNLEKNKSRCKKRPEQNVQVFKKKRQKGVEPSSSAWKAEIMSRYMTAAKDVNNLPD